MMTSQLEGQNKKFKNPIKTLMMMYLLEEDRKSEGHNLMSKMQIKIMNNNKMKIEMSN